MRLTIQLLDYPTESLELRNHTSFEPVEHQLFDTQHVVLDNRQFINCRFQACILLYAGGPFAMIGCDIDEETFVELTGAAARGQVFWKKLESRQRSATTSAGDTDISV